MIDWTRVAILRDEVGEEGFSLVVEIFLDEVAEVIARLQSPVLQRLEAELHFLKGSALNLGFATLAAFCEAGERMAASGQGATVDINRILESYEVSRGRFLAGLADGLGRPPDLSVAR